MRSQPIKRTVDATETQQRIILHLSCGHNVSITSRQLQAERHIVEQLQTATHWPCPYCPDPKPPAKTAQQMWREAGEP